MKKHSIYAKLAPLSLMVVTFGQGSFPSVAMEDLQQKENKPLEGNTTSPHHSTLCKVLTNLEFDQHHFESPTALSEATERAAKIVHNATVDKVRASIEADKQPEVSPQPAASSTVLGTLGAIAYSPFKLAGYVGSSLPGLPFTSKTPVPSSSVNLAPSEPINSGYVVVAKALNSSGPAPVIFEDYIGSSGGCGNSNKPWKVIFSFDGGGGRGYIGARIVEKLEMLTNRRLFELGDSSIGSSIGGIMQHGFFSTRDGINPLQDGRSTVTMFETKLHKIFPKRWQYDYLGRLYDSATGLLYSQYSDGPVNEFLEDEFGNLTVANTLLPTTTTAFNPDHDAPFLFSSDLTPKYKVWQTARSSSAAPSYFNLFQPDIDGSIVGQPFLGDGGLVYNNPAMIGILEEKRRAPHKFSLEKTVLFSVGTGWASVEDKLPIDAGALRAARPVISAVINSQVKGTELAMETLLQRKNNFRLNPKLDKAYALDDVSPAILKYYGEVAETQFRLLEEFVDHPAVRAKLEAPRRSDAF